MKYIVKFVLPNGKYQYFRSYSTPYFTPDISKAYLFDSYRNAADMLSSSQREVSDESVVRIEIFQKG